MNTIERGDQRFHVHFRDHTAPASLHDGGKTPAGGHDNRPADLRRQGNNAARQMIVVVHGHDDVGGDRRHHEFVFGHIAIMGNEFAVALETRQPLGQIGSDSTTDEEHGLDARRECRDRPNRERQILPVPNWAEHADDERVIG